MSRQAIERSRATDQVPLFIGGPFVNSATADWTELTSPATQDGIAQLLMATNGEMQPALDSAQTAFEGWRDRKPTCRTGPA